MAATGLKFQPPQGMDTTSPNEAFNKGLGDTVRNLPLLYMQTRQQFMENQLKEKTLAAQLADSAFNRDAKTKELGMKEKELGIKGYEAETGRIRAENQPDYVVPIYDETGNVTGFAPVPKGSKPFGGKQPQKGDKTESEKTDARSRVSDNLKQMEGLYQQLSDKGAIVDSSKGMFSNAVRAARSSGPGQYLGKKLGTNAQSIRNQIKQIQPLLIQDIRQAAKMGARGLDSEKELAFYLQAATDPSLDIQANLNALKVLENAYGLSAGGGDLNAPKVGEVRKGYRFKGGNPADKNSWEKE